MSDATDPLREIADFVISDASLPELMQRIASIAKATIEPVDEASVTFTRGDNRGWTVASTGELATVLDEAQYGLGHGPCLDAGSGGEIIWIRDFHNEKRYPDYAPIAIEAGAGSTVSVPFPVQRHVVAALNTYSRKVDGYSDEDVSQAVRIAAAAAVAVTNAHLYETAVEQAAQMQEAMRSRAVIEQAKGVLVATLHCSPEVAFDHLVTQSQHANRKLRDVAAEVVERAQHDRV